MNLSAEKVKALRIHHGWSQERLAQISGLSERTVQRVEQGDSASMDTRLALATAFEVTPAELCEDEEVVVGNGGINWSGVAGLLLCTILMATQFYLPGTLFFDLISLLLTVGIAGGMMAISMGGKETMAVVAAVRWVVILPNQQKSLTTFLPGLNRIIFYCYSAGALSTLVGIIAVFMTPANAQLHWPYQPASEMHMGLGIALLTLLYAVMLAELIFRPLKHQLERMLICHQQAFVNKK